MNLLNTKFSNLTYVPRPADIPNTKPLCQHDPQHAIVSVAPHFAGGVAHSAIGIAHVGAVRETEHQPRSWTLLLCDGSHDFPDGADAIGRNEGTVRFSFGPHGGA
jgi:hypothetical protein